MFQVQNGVIWARFSTRPTSSLFRWCSHPKKSSTFDWIIFSCTDGKLLQLHHKHCGYVSGAKWSDPGPVFIFAGSRPILVVSGPGKVINIRLKHFLAVLTGNDKNCTPNSMRMFRVQNRVICSRCKTFPALVVFGSEKAVKIWGKYFLAVLTEKDKNCKTKSFRPHF